MAMKLFVNGTLMRGLPLHSNLDGAKFLGEFTTLPIYRIYSINDIHPGMFELDEREGGGVSVSGELYDISDEIWAKVEKGEPPNLYKGTVKLSNLQSVDGILFPRSLAEDPKNGYKDISKFADWRLYMSQRTKY